MKEARLYKLISIGLLLLNLGMMGFLLLTKPQGPHRGPHKARGHHHPKGDNFKSDINHILKFDEAQRAQFDILATAHRDNMEALSTKQKDILVAYFEDLTESTLERNNDSLIKQNLSYEEQKMEITRAHLIDIKNLLNENQLPEYKTFLDSFLDRVVLAGKNNRPPPDGKQ